MSEAQDLNDSSPPDPADSEPSNNEIEQLLRSLVPRQLAIDRDRLFFEAGMAAAGGVGSRGPIARFAWPAVAATLLVACGGLAVQLARESTALEAALAAAAPKPAEVIASDDSRAGRGTVEIDPHGRTAASSPAVVGHGGRFDPLPQPRRLEQVLSLERVPGSQLTAQGWVEAPSESTWDIEPASRTEPEPRSLPARLPTYLELIRAERG